MTFACMTTRSCTRQNWLWEPSRVEITIQNELDLPKSLSFACNFNTYAGQFLACLLYIYILCCWPIKWKTRSNSKQPRKIVWLQQRHLHFLRLRACQPKGRFPCSPFMLGSPEGTKEPFWEAPMFLFVETSNAKPWIQNGGFIDLYIHWKYRWSHMESEFYIGCFVVMMSLICLFLWGMLVGYTLNCCWILFPGA